MEDKTKPEECSLCKAGICSRHQHKPEEELKKLLDDRRTGLKDSSNTNKTRYAILALFDEARQEERKRIIEWAIQYMKDSIKERNKTQDDHMWAEFQGHAEAMDNLCDFLKS